MQKGLAHQQAAQVIEKGYYIEFEGEPGYDLKVERPRGAVRLDSTLFPPEFFEYGGSAVDGLRDLPRFFPIRALQFSALRIEFTVLFPGVLPSGNSDTMRNLLRHGH